MKLNILTDHDHRMSGGRVMALKGDTQVDVHHTIGKVLIDLKVAEKPKDETVKGDADNG